MDAAKTLDESMTEIAAWQRETFPKATAASVLAHMHREMRELEAELMTWKGRPRSLVDEVDRRKVGAEIADLFHLIVALSGALDLDLADEVERKFEINVEREWGEPDSQGVVEHVRR